MPAPYAGKSARSSKKATKDNSELANSKSGRALSIKRTLKSDKSGSKAKSALPAELDGAGQREKSKDQDWDIDSLFATVKKAKKSSTAAKETPDLKSSERKRRKQTVQGSKDNIFGEAAAQDRRRTEEGYAIYSEQELHINNGGGTDKCPFDCQCCF